VEQLLPHLGWRLLHQAGDYGPSGSGQSNEFAAAELVSQPTRLQQAVATFWTMIAAAV